MERWEHLLIRIVPTPNGRAYDLSPRQPDLDSNLDNVSPDHTVALFDELGDAGWQLFSFDAQQDGYWMKRQKPEQSSGGWAIGV